MVTKLTLDLRMLRIRHLHSLHAYNKEVDTEAGQKNSEKLDRISSRIPNKFQWNNLQKLFLSERIDKTDKIMSVSQHT